MLDTSLFSRFLQKIQVSQTQKEKIQVLFQQNNIKNDFDVQENSIILHTVSVVQKRELFLKKESIEQSVCELLGKKYSIKIH